MLQHSAFLDEEVQHTQAVKRLISPTRYADQMSDDGRPAMLGEQGQDALIEALLEGTSVNGR